MNVKRNLRMSPQKTSGKTTVTLPKEGMTLLAFLGRGSNSRPFYGATQRYVFGGKHHQTGNVLDSDVAIFLGKKENGKTLFEVVKVVKAQVIETLPAPGKEVYVRPTEPVAALVKEIATKKVAKKKAASKKKPNA
jgi:hypothetical protein